MQQENAIPMQQGEVGARDPRALDGQGATTEVTQYGLGRILAIWAAAALPMGALRWVVAPILAPRVGFNPGFLYLILITLGLTWQCVLSHIILRGEVRPFTWQGLKERLWLQTPSNPRTGAPSKWLYLWTIPVIVFNFAAYEVSGPLNDALTRALPFLAPAEYMQIQNLAEPARGQWWLLGVLVILIVGNYLLGEGMIFHGILLPRMIGRFGKYDWLANHILFVTYHLHKIEVWPSILLINWVWPLTTRRLESYWVAVIVHGIDAVTLIGLFTLAILGMV